MKKLLALIVALVMALSCTLALAEESAAFPGITISAELDVDREAAGQYLEMFGVEEDMLATANGVVALLDALRETTVITSGGLQYELGLNDTSVLSLGGSLTNEGIVVVSSLFPNYAITVSMETVMGILEQAMASLPFGGSGDMPFDVNAVIEAVSGYSQSFIDSVSGAVSMGDTEVGEFEYEGHVFNAKTAVNVDMKVIADAMNTLIDQMNNDETVQAALKAMQDAGMNIASDEGEVNIDPETAPNVEGWIYTYVDEAGNAGDEVYVLVNVTPKDDTDAATIVHTLVLGQEVNVTVEVPAESTTVKVKVQPKDDGIAMRFDANAAGMYFAIALDVATADTIHGVLDIYFLSDVKPLATATLDIAMSGELTMDVTGAGKKVVAAETLMSGDESASEASSGLMMDLLLNGLGGVMGAITENVPELGDVIGSLAGGMMGA